MRAAASQNVNCPPSQVCSGMVHDVLRGLSSLSGIKADGDEVSYCRGREGYLSTGNMPWCLLRFAEVLQATGRA